MNLSIFTFPSPAGPLRLLHRDSEKGLGGAGRLATPAHPGPAAAPAHMARPCPAGSESTRLQYKEQRAQKPSNSVLLPRPVSDLRCLWRLVLLGVPLGVPRANRGSPGCAQWQGPPARHPGGAWMLGLLMAAQSPFLQPGPGHSVALPAPGRAVAHPPAWPRVAPAPKTRA